MTISGIEEYRFFDVIIFDLQNKKLFNIETNTIVTLRNTKFRLLRYLVQNARKRVITDSELLLNVWELNGLSASNQRLSQVVANLKMIINKLDAHANLLILRVRDPATNELGYMLNKEHVIQMYPATI